MAVLAAPPMFNFKYLNISPFKHSKNMKMPSNFKKQIEVSPLEEQLLTFLTDPTEAKARIEALRWVFEAAAFGGQTHLDFKMQSHLFEIYELNEILRGNEMGF